MQDNNDAKFCSICRGMYKDPRILPNCGHTFCRACLQEQCQRPGERKSTRHCVLCGAEWRLSSNIGKQLKKNHALSAYLAEQQHFLELLDQHQQDVNNLTRQLRESELKREREAKEKERVLEELNKIQQEMRIAVFHSRHSETQLSQLEKSLQRERREKQWYCEYAEQKQQRVEQLEHELRNLLRYDSKTLAEDINQIGKSGGGAKLSQMITKTANGRETVKKRVSFDLSSLRSHRYASDELEIPTPDSTKQYQKKRKDLRKSKQG